MRRRTWIVMIVLFVLGAGAWLGWQSIQRAQAARDGWETVPLTRADLLVTVRADGAVRANQSAVLLWKTSGEVAPGAAPVGQAVAAGEVLLNLETASLPEQTILAQADLVEAERTLQALYESGVYAAQARQVLEDAQQALEDGQNPALLQAQARAAVAQARQALADAQDYHAIVSQPAPQSAVEQARANLLLAEHALNRTLEDIARIEQRMKDPDQYIFFESKQFYQQILDGLEQRRIQQQLNYEHAQEKYDSLLEPPDPVDVLVAEGTVFKAQATLAQAQRELERVANGLSTAELALLEANVEEARREWERWQAGPDPAEITAAEARLEAAQAALAQTRIEAPFAGTLTALYSKPGDRVIAGTPALRLDNLEPLLVDLQLSEIDINRLSLGQEVVVTFEAAPGREYRGHIVEVPAFGEEAGGVVYFNVVIALDDADASVRPQMTAAATIVTARLTNVLQVPNRALRLLEGERVVYVLRAGQVAPVPVTLGVASETMTQVLGDTLSPDDQIVLNPDMGLLR